MALEESGSSLTSEFKLRHVMPTFPLSIVFRLASLMLLALAAVTSAIQAEDPPPDPAQHGAIVPYDGKNPPNLEQANRFYLDYQDFQRLWDLAKAHRLPTAPTDDDLHAPPSVSVVTALYRGEILKDHVHFDVQFEVVSHGQWAKWVPFAESKPNKTVPSRVITALGLDGQAVALDEAGALVLAQPGQHHVELSLDAGIDGDWKQLNWVRPQSSAAILELTVPSTEGTPVFVSDRWFVEEDQNGKRVFIVPLTANQPLSIMRGPARKFEAAAPPASVHNTLQLTASLHMDTVQARLSFNFLGTARDHFTVRFDDNLRVRSWSVPDLLNASLRHLPGEFIAEIRLQHPVTDSYTMELVAERPYVASTGRRSAPHISGEAVVSDATFNLLAATDLAVRPEPSPEARQIPAQSPAPPYMLDAGTWRLANAKQTFAYEVTPAPNHRTATLQTLYQLTRQKAEIISVLRLDVAQESIQEIRIETPKHYEVQSFTGAQLRGWRREGDALMVQLDPTARQATLTLHLAQTATQPTANWHLEPIRLNDYSKYQGRAFVAVHVADDVQVRYSGQQAHLREVDPGTSNSLFSVSAPFTLSRAFDVESSAWSADVILNRPPARYAADAVLLAQVTDTSVTFSQHLGIQIERGALDNIKLRLPKDLPEARVDGEWVRDAQSHIEGGEREYQITFQSEILDRAEFSLNYDLPLAGDKTLPVVQAMGADRLRTFLMVDNASFSELHLQPGDAEPIVASSLPYVPEGLLRPQFFQANPKTQLSFSLTQLDSSAAQSAVVTFAEITTDLRANGERWDTVVYSLINRSLQFLPVLLPEDANLIEVSVSHQTTRADLGAQAPPGRKEYLVPLIQMRPGELSQEVRLVYRSKADARRLQLRQPELLHMSVERTLWHVHAPEGYELRSKDTNMEQVNATAATNVKSQRQLEEIARINRLLQSHALGSREAQEAYAKARAALSDIQVSSAAQGNKAVDGAAELAEATRAQTDLMNRNGARMPKPGFQFDYPGSYSGNSAGVPILSEIPVIGRLFQAKEAAPASTTTWASQGSGQITVANANTYTGATVVSGGTLALNDNVAVGNLASDVSKLPSSSPAAKSAQAAETHNARAFNKEPEESRAQVLEEKVSPRSINRRRIASELQAPVIKAVPMEADGTPVQPARDEDQLSKSQIELGRLSALSKDIKEGTINRSSGAIQHATQTLYATVLAQQPTTVAASAALTPQLKPTGRLSLAVEIPKEGFTYHFTKLNDHAEIQLSLQKLRGPQQTNAMWALLNCGILALIIVAVRQYRRKRRAQAGLMAAAS